MSTATTAHIARPAAAQTAGAAVPGAVAGIAASMVMAAYAMIASATYQHRGFFTPLDHIASVFIAPTELMTSMQNAMMGHTYTFALGPALLGALVHMMTGAVYGALFAVAASMLRLRGMVLMLGGVAWGAVAFALSSWVLLPVTASVLSSGDQITHMAKMVGYPTFLAEHLLFGLALGMMLAARRSSSRQ
jgi:hypothetical protein